MAELAAEDARLRDDERRVVARKLHHVVTHQLSNVSLQVMSHVDAGDAEELRRVLAKVGRSTESALTELRLPLVGRPAIVRSGGGLDRPVGHRVTMGAGLTVQDERSGLSPEQRIADGLRALRMSVMAFLGLDIVATLVGLAYGLDELGPSGLIPTVQVALIFAAATATLWPRVRAAIVLTAVVALLSLTVGPSGQEVWLLVITGVTGAARVRSRGVGGVLVALLAYAVVFGLTQEARNPGWGWASGLSTAGLAAAAVGTGFVARSFVRARDRRRQQVRALERENTEIRAVERTRLADDLQSVVTEGLSAIAQEVATADRRPDDGARLGRQLDQIEHRSRLLLIELRSLLEVLRRDRPPGSAHPELLAPPRRRWVDLLTARHVQLTTTVVFGLLAVRAVVVHWRAPTADLWVEVLALLACAVAGHRLRVGATLAGAALVATVVLDPTGWWDLLAAALLGLVETQRHGARRVWLVVLALAGYSALLVPTDSGDRVSHLILVGYVGGMAIAAGLTVRHFVEAQQSSTRRVVDLMAERERLEVEERSAVARELHDVVAHQLSLTTMLVMATSLSEDPIVLADTVAKIRRTTDLAHHELSTLVYAMRGPSADQVHPTPLTSPATSGQALARRLADSGFHLDLDLDPAAEALDDTTKRTLGRIMQEAATNIARYTPAGATCRYDLTVDRTGVRLVITSPLGEVEPHSDLSLGWGLRGIRERVDLTHGTFSAGADRGAWVLTVTLPVASKENRAVATTGGASRIDLRLPQDRVPFHSRD